MNVIYRSVRRFHFPEYSASRYFSVCSALNHEVTETLKTNPYFDKYSGKILEKQKVAPEEVSSSWSNYKKSKSKYKPSDPEKEKKPFSAGQAKVDISLAPTSQSNLDKVMKLELIKDKTGEEIKTIWEDFHKSKDCTVSASVPVDKFNMIIEKSKSHPVFLLPLPRNEGYEFIVLQFCGNEVHFTPLISYQTHKENAPECLTIIYYPDLIEEKNVVLMRGEYNKNVINVIEAQCLANQLQIFYGEKNEKRDKIMNRFTNYPDEFKHMDIVAEIECLSI